MSRRARAAAFLLVAAVCSVLAASIVDGYGTSVAGQYGELRPVVVAAGDLPAREPIGPRELQRLELRRVPASFAPPDALTSPQDAAGRAPVAAVPTGSYLLGSQLRSPRSDRDRPRKKLARGRRPVEISVTGAEALAAVGEDPVGGRVDVVVTSEPGPGAKGRTRVAAAGVELLALEQGGGGGGSDSGLGAGGGWSATLALTRSQALRLIQAENFARQVRLMPHLDRR
jgi:Flp pilus assembly protein CpaB